MNTMALTIAKLTQRCILQQARLSSNSLACSAYSLHLPLLPIHKNNNGSNKKFSISPIDNGHKQAKNLLCNQSTFRQTIYYLYSTESAGNCNFEKKENGETKPAATYKEKLKQAVAQYGSTVLVFHITISLISLGVCYAVVASGLDLSALFEKVGLSEKSINKLASSSGTFAAAYLVHKVFAPVRISITLTCTPFIVRYLRKAGFIKKALPKLKEQVKK